MNGSGVDKPAPISSATPHCYPRRDPEASELSSKAGGQVLEEVVEVAVAEVQLLKDAGDLLTLLALGAEDAVDHNVGGDDVRVAGSGAGDFVGLDGEVFLSEEGGKVHRGGCLN